METLLIPNESDIKKWVQEAMKEYLTDFLREQRAKDSQEADLLNRKEVAKFLRVSLVTLTDWMKHGLPSHKQGGRIYFDKKEVL